jgi:hypothetical protein
MSGRCLVASLDWVKMLYIISGYYCYVSNFDCPLFMAFLLCHYSVPVFVLHIYDVTSICDMGGSSFLDMHF